MRSSVTDASRSAATRNRAVVNRGAIVRNAAIEAATVAATEVEIAVRGNMPLYSTPVRPPGRDQEILLER